MVLNVDLKVIRCPITVEPPARLTPSMRDPVHVATLEWSLCLAPPMSFIRLMMQRTGFQPKGSSRPEVGLEAHVNQGPHLRGSKIHQGGIAPAPLPGFRFGAGPERLHLFLDLKQDLALSTAEQIGFSRSLRAAGSSFWGGMST